MPFFNYFLLLYILCWIIFVGLGIEAGGIIFNIFYVLAINPAGAKSFWMEADLSFLLAYDRGHFFVQGLLIAIVALAKAILFYLIIKILHDKKLNMSQPFNEALGALFFTISYLSLIIGLFSIRGIKYSEWLSQKGIAMPRIEYLRLRGADVWIFMGVILFFIAHIFKRGIEIQTENELTV